MIQWHNKVNMIMMLTASGKTKKTTLKVKWSSDVVEYMLLTVTSMVPLWMEPDASVIHSKLHSTA